MSIVDTSRMRFRGPLLKFKEGFAEELHRRGYRHFSAANQLQVMSHLSRWMEGKGLGPGDLTLPVAEEFLAARRAAGYTHYLTDKALAPLLAYLRELGAIPPPPPDPPPAGPVAELLERFCAYSMRERGVQEKSARRQADRVRPLLESLASPEGLDLSELDPAVISAFVLDSSRRLSRQAAQGTVAATRSLLGFLHHEGEIERPLSDAVPQVGHWRGQGLPKGLAPKELQKLLDSCDPVTPMGRRDLAILALLSRIGLRAGEVAGLCLEDIDWRGGEILIRGKGRRSERLPLPADVGELVADYLRDGRPAEAEGRAVFIRALAPYRALSASGVTTVVKHASRRAGLGQIFAHRLRHTAATEALRGGATLPQVGQLLRHNRMATTAIYAKVDRERLRTLARPWPEVVS
jgi:site-specific recombinase XerD